MRLIEILQTLIGIYISAEATALFLWSDNQKLIYQIGRIVRVVIGLFIIFVAKRWCLHEMFR